MHQSRVGYYADFVVYPVAIFGLLLAQIVAAKAGERLWLIAPFVGGLVLWTLLEYGLHRFVFHRFVFVRDLHEAHHADPTGLIGSPVFVSVSCFIVFALAPSWLILGPVVAFGLTAGLMLGYLGYLLVHHGVHHWRIEPGSRLYVLKHRHARHHHSKIDGNFGVITNFWDRVFGTSLDSRARTRDGRAQA